MIKYCPCGQALPHDKGPHCEKPRVRVPTPVPEPIKQPVHVTYGR